MKVFGTSCSICLDDFEREDYCALPACGHILHRYCFDELLKQTDSCPSCRGYVAKILTREEMLQHAQHQGILAIKFLLSIAFLVDLLVFRMLPLGLFTFPFAIKFTAVSLVVTGAAGVVWGLYTYAHSLYYETIPITYASA